MLLFLIERKVMERSEAFFMPGSTSFYLLAMNCFLLSIA